MKETTNECQWENCSGGEYCEKHSLLTKSNTMSSRKEDGVKERIAKMRSLGMEISPAMEIIILKECDFAYDKGVSAGKERLIAALEEKKKELHYTTDNPEIDGYNEALHEHYLVHHRGMPLSHRLGRTGCHT